MKDIIIFLLKVVVVTIGAIIFYNIIRFPHYAIIIFPFFVILIITSHLLRDIFLEIVILFVIILSGIFISLLIYNEHSQYNPIFDKIIILLEIGWIIGCFYLLQKNDEKINQKQTLYLERKENLARQISTLKFTKEKAEQEIYNNSIQIKNFNLIEKVAEQLSAIVSLKELKTFVENKFPEFFLRSAEVKLILENPEDEFEINIINETKSKYLYVPDVKKYHSVLTNNPELKSIICLPLEENIGQNKNINFLLITSKEYLSEDFLRFAMILSKYVTLNIVNIKLIEMTKELSITDSLTGLFVQKYFKEVLQEEVNRAKCYNKKLSIVMIDIDNFKNINDTYGHNAGDEVLVRFADILRSRLRETDIISRYGGDEFGIILPDADQQDSFKIVEEIRAIVANEVVISKYLVKGRNKKIKFSISCGVVEYDKNYTVEEFIDLVDKRLYKAKSLGKNRTVI
ncbi:MAG: GGDEF domain-containing protein [Endomicrobiia bacterium]